MYYKNKLNSLAKSAGTRVALLMLGSTLLMTSCAGGDKKYSEEEYQKALKEAEIKGKKAERKRAKKEIEESAHKAAMATMGSWGRYKSSNILTMFNQAIKKASKNDLDKEVLKNLVFVEGDPKNGFVQGLNGAFAKAVEEAVKKVGNGLFRPSADKNSDFVYFIWRTLKLIEDLDATFKPGKYSKDAIEKLKKEYETDMAKIKVNYKFKNEDNKPLDTEATDKDPDEAVKEATKHIVETLGTAHTTYRKALGLDDSLETDTDEQQKEDTKEAEKKAEAAA